MIRVRILKILLFAVPLALVIVVLRGLGESCRTRDLPDGYGLVRETATWRVYGPESEPSVAAAGPKLDEFMDAFRATYREEFRLVERSELLTLYIFRRTEDFRRFSNSRLTDDTSRIAGYYWAGSRTIAAIAHEGLGLHTLRHEAVHAIMDLEVAGSDHAWPPWLGEGLAQAFEEGRVVEGRLRPGPLEESQAILLRRAHAAGRLEPTSRLVARSHDEFMADATLNYAHAAALVLWLLEERREEFVAYFDLESRPGPLDQRIFPTRFGGDVRDEMMAWIGS